LLGALALHCLDKIAILGSLVNLGEALGLGELRIAGESAE
jgi:hypothetical protein